MTFLPIVDRELRVAARRVSTYRNRVLTPVLLAVVVIAKAFLVPFPAASAAQLGAAMFETLSALALAFCVLAGVRDTADCLSEERRGGTLGLLFLTDLKGYDIILGKLAVASLTSIYGLCAMVPILGWSIFLGGVTYGEIGRMALALLNILLFSLAAGIWVSSRSRWASRAMAGTIGLVLLFFIVPVPIKTSLVAPLSPAYAFFGAWEGKYNSNPMAYWESLLFTQIVVGALLLRASITINRFREEQNIRSDSASKSLSWLRSKAGDLARRTKLRTKLLGINPVLWLASHNVGSRAVIWLLVFIAGGGIACVVYFTNFYRSPATTPLLGNVDFVFVAFVLLINSLMKSLLAAQACRCLAEARHNSTLEVLLCTPLKVEEILHGQILSLKRTFLAPLMCLMLFEAFGLFWMLYNGFHGASGITAGHGINDALFFVEAGFIIFFLLDFQGVTWAGIWFGLCSKNENRATFKTIFYVVVLPLLLLVIYCIGTVLFVLWPIVSFVWARLKLQEHFRTLAGKRSASSSEAEGWVPFEIPEIIEEEPLAGQFQK
ncbi:MAG: hypothetical protein JWQ71_4444 [Pedosphaera sp.]|nr:hypothetical protein [Pedosphaera sp.]